MTKNHFETLGLKPGAKEDDIKKAYRNLAKQWHPDKNNQHGAEEKFKEISAAYEYLKCENRREILERDLNKSKPNESSSSYNFKSEYKSSQNGESDSYWSKKFGQKSENRYKNSTFSNFADEGRDPPSNKKKEPKPNQKKKKSSKPTNRQFSHGWNHMDDEEEYYDIPRSAHSAHTAGSRPNFSFAFKSFVDDLGMSFDAFFMGPSMSEPFQFSSFFDGPDPFTEFFRQGSLYSLRKGPSPRRPRKHDTAPEEGAEGLDPEYLFTPPSTQRAGGSSYSNKENLYTDNDTTVKDESDDDDMDSRLFKCTYCERRMPFSQLSTHEPGCALRRGGKFEPPPEEEYDNYNHYEYESPDEDQYPQKTGDWRQTHQELLRNIRRAKARHSAGSRMTSDTPRMSTDTNKSTTDETLTQTRCKWCGRYFSNPAARHHIPFCEKWTKEHGTPLNPAGKSTARDKGSKNQKAKEYAKHIPKPRAHSEEKSFEPESPTSPRSSFDNFQPDFGSKRETMNKQTPSSGTGLHASTSYTPREKPERQSGTPGFTRKSYTQPGKPTMNGTGAGRFSAMNGETSSSYRNGGLDDGYSFGISGSRLKPDTRPSGLSPESCQLCVKKYGMYGRFVCSCGNRRKTGAA